MNRLIKSDDIQSCSKEMEHSNMLKLKEAVKSPLSIYTVPDTANDNQN